MKIGILQCGHTPDAVHAAYGDFDALFHHIFEGHGFMFETFNVVDMEFPSGPEDADGWLVTGSRHGAYENHAFIPPLEDLIRSIHAANRPMIGICFGHQIIAQAMGGKVEKFSGGWAIGRHDYQFDGLGDAALNAWHQDQVVERPKGAKTIASSPFCENAALVYGDRIMTVQPHPEIRNPVVATYLESFRGHEKYPADLMARAAETVETPNDEARVAAMLATFLKTREVPA
ncbi:MAG: type 1 glutamine amidotransferase [Pseudomonadota bacterium]